MTDRILIVDDFEDARDLYAEYLQMRGFEVARAADGEAALQLAAAPGDPARPAGARAIPSGFDLIVLDLALPRMDGIAVLLELRRSSSTADIPVIILSASADPGAREASLSAGADLFLEKPCLPEELEKAVRTLLDGRRPQAQQG